MAQNPYGGPPPFAGPAFFPPPFQPGVPYYAQPGQHQFGQVPSVPVHPGLLQQAVSVTVPPQQSQDVFRPPPDPRQLLGLSRTFHPPGEPPPQGGGGGHQAYRGAGHHPSGEGMNRGGHQLSGDGGNYRGAGPSPVASNWGNHDGRGRGRGGGGDNRGGSRGRGFGERGGGGRGDRGGPRPSSSGDFGHRGSSSRGGYGSERERPGSSGDFNRQGEGFNSSRPFAYGERPGSRGAQGAGPSRTPTPTSSHTGAADLGSDFGDMGAAAKNYAKAVPKFPAGMGGSGGAGGGVPKVEDFNAYRKENCLVVYDSVSQGVHGVPDPFKKFSDFPGLSKAQLDCFSRAGFQSPTPIQAQSWPVALTDRDVISIAKTGSGKTLAFLLPAYRKMDERQVRVDF